MDWMVQEAQSHLPFVVQKGERQRGVGRAMCGHKAADRWWPVTHQKSDCATQLAFVTSIPFVW